MPTKKKAVTKPAPVKKNSARKVAILAILEGEQFAGNDSAEKLELLRAAVEKTLETDMHLSKVLVPALIYDVQTFVCAPQPKVTTSPPPGPPRKPPKPKQPRTPGTQP